jgi:TolB protein
MRSKITRWATILAVWTAFAGNVTAQTQNNSVTVSSSGQPLLINIDNPNFRKLSAALPYFRAKNPLKNSANEKFLRSGPEELQRLLEFSGLFNVVDRVAYDDLAKELYERLNQLEKKVYPLTTTDLGDFSGWRNINIESLTFATLNEEDSGLTVEFRTVDVSRSQVLLAKRYTKVEEKDFIPLVRRYANLILETYTGRPGIFSSKITFVGRKTKDSAKQIFVCDFDGSNVRQITSDNAPHVSPHFSPDGKFLTYTSFKNRNPDLYIHDLATGKSKLLSGNKGINSGGQWAPSGKVIAYTGSKDGNSDIYSILPNGTKRKLLITGSGLDVDPTFSPDGNWLAFVSGRFGNPHIFVAALQWEGSESVKIVRDQRLTYAGWYNATPAWSPDSKKIAFGGYDKDIDRFDIFMMDPNGQNLERLTLKRGDNEAPTWSPNGQLIMFQSNRVDNRDVKGRAQLYVMNKDGSNQRMINTGMYEAQTPAWSGPLY